MTLQRKGIIGLLVGLLVLAAGASVYFVFFGTRVWYQNIGAIKASSGLQIVLPAELPQGSRILDQPVYEPSKAVITTRLKISGATVTLSQQKRPGTDLKQVDAEETFLVNAGSVYILKGEQGQLQAIVETSDSWLMVNADAQIGVRVFKQLLESLDTVT